MSVTLPPKNSIFWVYCSCALEILIGVLIAINPTGFSGLIISLLGILLVVLGAQEIIRYFKTDPNETAFEMSLAKGLVFVFVGLFCLCQFEWISAAMAIMTSIYGLIIFALGIIKIQWSVNLLRRKRHFWYFAGASALLSLIFALVILCNPFESGVMWVLIAVALIVCGLADVVCAFYSTRVKLETSSGGTVMAEATLVDEGGAVEEAQEPEAVPAPEEESAEEPLIEPDVDPSAPSCVSEDPSGAETPVQ